MSSITVICPNQRRYPVKVTPGTLLHKVVEEACLKAGYEVAGVVAKNQNKIVDLALPFRLSGLPNNATIELSISDKPKNQSVELAIQLPDNRRQIASFASSSTLVEVLEQFSTLLNENILSTEGGIPSCVYMNRKYVGPELENTTLTSMGISGGKCLLRYQKVEISHEELVKLEEKAAHERKRLASLSSTFTVAKKENEERDRLEAARLTKFEAECKVREEEEAKKREERMRELEREVRESQMEVDPQHPINRDRLPQQAQNDSWSFDAPFATQQEQPEAARQTEELSRLSQLNSLLERMDRSLSTGGSDNMVRAIADAGRMSLQQLTSAAETMEREPEPPVKIFDEPCPRNIVIFARGEETVSSETEEVAEFFDVNVDDVKKMQRDLKNQLKMQTQRSLIPKSFIEKKNKELKLEAWKHTAIRFIVGDQFIQANFKSGEPVSRLFEVVATFFQENVAFSLTAILNETVSNSSEINLIEADLSPMCNLTVKFKGSSAPLRADLARVGHSEADTMSKEWLSVNTTYKPYTGLMVEEERPVKRTADMRDYQSGGAKPPAPSGPKWFKSKFFTLLSVDQKEESMIFSGDFEMTWTDPFLSWDSAQHGGKDNLIVHEENVWIPDVTVYNSVTQTDVIPEEQRLITIHNDGSILRSSPAIYTTRCSMNMNIFPFDQQTCTVKLSSWVYSWVELTIDAPDWMFNFSKPDYTGNSEWDIVELKVLDVKTNDTDGSVFSELEYMVTLKRHSTYYICVIFIPTFIVTTLSLIGFFTPFDNEGNRVERVTLGLTTLLSLAVMLNIVGDNIPKSGNLPQLGGFVLAECLICCAAILVTIIMIFAHHRVSTRRILPPAKEKYYQGTEKGKMGLQALRSADGVRSLEEVQKTLEDVVFYLRTIEAREELRLYWLIKFDHWDLFFLVLFQIANIIIMLCYLLIR